MRKVFCAKCPVFDSVNKIDLWIISLQSEHTRGAIGAVVLLYHSWKKDWKSDISHNLHVRKGLIIDFDRGRPAD